MLGRAEDVKLERLLNEEEYEKWVEVNPNCTILQIHSLLPDGSIRLIYKET